MMQRAYLKYLLQKPFHSAKHKRLKIYASRVSREKHLYEKALQELVEYTHEDSASIEEKSKKLAAQLNQKDFDTLSDDELRSFYSDDRHYLYELPLWNAGSGRAYYFMEAVVPYLKRNGHRGVLDFGGGSGDLCIALSEFGFKCCYTDINKVLSEFSQWRFEKRNSSVTIFDADVLPAKTFDCIVSFDVFEHLKNLPEKINVLSSIIKPGGSLIFNIEFSGEGLHLRENKRYSDFRILDCMLNRAGLKFDEKFKNFLFYKKI